MSIPEGFKCMLAGKLTQPEKLRFPVIVSPKIDGIRCVVFGGVAYAGRSMKPIPNQYVQVWAMLYSDLLDGLDGELVVGSATDPNCMQNSMAVMRVVGEPDFTFHVFDRVPTGTEDKGYSARCVAIQNGLALRAPRAVLISYGWAHDTETLGQQESFWVGDGYEGMMIRSLSGLYKYGRSTEKEQGLLKVKRFSDAEAVIVGFEEEQHNTNEATKDNNGHTERSTAKAGLIGKGTLGALKVRDLMRGFVFNIGTGFTAAQRAEYWADRDALQGRIVKYKHFEHGVVTAPRHPVFIGFRALEDMQQ